jgi:tRNA nucleotidyltransferase (CCA-adding enzyme)
MGQHSHSTGESTLLSKNDVETIVPATISARWQAPKAVRRCGAFPANMKYSECDNNSLFPTSHYMPFRPRILSMSRRPFIRFHCSMAPSLKLDPREKLLKDCLAECAQTIPPLEIRFAGGWVRDKLLGQQSNDIDAALSSYSGKDFGQIFLHFYNKYGAKYRDEARRLGIDNIELNKIVLVDEDAEKSKHLAVAKMKLFGLEVDLVNLRTEVYASDSRTPEVKMGTAEEDALRRDATINALFYNIHTEQVEDFTGKGLDDMKNKIMRTPLDPHQTFRDDPLRVLRLIRFASRLDFEIDSAARLAMEDPTIHQALKLKISRERVRIEIMKAFSFDGPRPAKALHYIYELNLFSSCFAHPQDTNPPRPSNLPETCTFVSKVLANNLLSSGLQLHQESAALPWLLAAYTPWAASPPNYGCQAIKEGMKATAREAKLLTASLTNQHEIASLIQEISQSGSTVTRSKVGMSLRRWGPTWGHQALFTLLCRPESLTAFENFLHQLARLGLDGTKALEEKPLLDGRKIIEILARKPGPGNKFAADLVMEWQFDNPAGDAGECAEMLRGSKERILAWEEGRKGGRGKDRPKIL